MLIFSKVKRLVLSIVFSTLISTVLGSHLSGGNIMYEYVGPGAFNSKLYKITLILYRDENCGFCPPMPSSARITIYATLRNNVVSNNWVNLSSTENIYSTASPCIQNPPFSNYVMGKYTFTADLPNSDVGYTIAYQGCCRPNNLMNVSSKHTIASTVGVTYFAIIPGYISFPIDFTDTSPVFTKVIPVLCANKVFSFDMSATDTGGYGLEYSFTNAYEDRPADSLDFNLPAGNNSQSGPFFDTVVIYSRGYSGSMPLGPNVTIDRNTGIVSGLAPPAGKYLISVLVKAYQYPFPNIQAIYHRKDLIVTVTDCDAPGVFLKPKGYLNCKDSSITFENFNNSDLNKTFDWDFGDPGSGALNYSTQPAPIHTFSAAGNYNIKLVVNKGTACADSGTTSAKLYPGFYPGYTVNTPQCINSPVYFTDTTKATYGKLNFWLWDFGDFYKAYPTSSNQNSNYSYGRPDIYLTRLVVGSDKGCRDTVYTRINIIDKPTLDLGNDTLICSIDTLQLKAQTIGSPQWTITWLPNYMINDTHSFTPLVSPNISTTYYATFSNNLGCDVTDSLQVHVVDFVTLQARGDTTVCSTDAVKLAIISDGLHYVWSPTTDLNNPLIKTPTATPARSTVYNVVASIGGCSSTANIAIKAVDYPKANAGQDSAVCLGTSAYLHASGGAYYFWSPSIFLTGYNISNPTVVNPYSSIKYVVTVRDTLGCPKPVKDTVIISVIKIKADAGPRDTAVVTGQPLQLNATGAVNYAWTPGTWLNNPAISNPIALPAGDIMYIVKATDASGCMGTDSINVKLYSLPPGLYVPNAFTPNGDGVNDLFRPVPLGMKTLIAFRIYNRAGQLVYSGIDAARGWDGKFKSVPQATGTFVWYAEGIDYLNNKMQRQGYVMLIR